jgi:histone deacetylase complex regulatory component SIN3
MNEEEKKNYKLCSKKFNVLRIMHMKNIYGEMGKELVSLLYKNPSKAIPIILDRLKLRYNQIYESKKDLMKGWIQ